MDQNLQSERKYNVHVPEKNLMMLMFGYPLFFLCPYFFFELYAFIILTSTLVLGIIVKVDE